MTQPVVYGMHHSSTDTIKPEDTNDRSSQMTSTSNIQRLRTYRVMEMGTDNSSHI
jgi:hypothetical protein